MKKCIFKTCLVSLLLVATCQSAYAKEHSIEFVQDKYIARSDLKIEKINSENYKCYNYKSYEKAEILEKPQVISPTVYRENSSISVIVNGNELSFDTEPKIIDDTTFVPMRAIFEALGAQVEWEPRIRTIFAKKGSTEIELTIGEAAASVNGKVIMIPGGAPYIDSSSNSTMVPLRFISESLGCNVQWNQEDKSITITG